MEPLYFANFIFLPLYLAVVYFLGQTKETIGRWSLLGVVILLLTNLILTVSRGAYIGFVVAFLVLAVLLFKKIFTWKHIFIIFFSLSLVGYGVAYALSKGDTRATNEFLKHVLVKDYKVGESVQGRLSASGQAYSAFQSNPVLGIGLGNYGPYVKSYPASTPKDGWPIVNNEYLEIMAETGLLGVTSFGLIILVLLLRSLKAIFVAKDQFLRLTMIGALCAFVGVMIQYSFFSTLYIIHIWILFGLMVGIQNLILKPSIQQVQDGKL
jgi:O-antigen ligase